MENNNIGERETQGSSNEREDQNKPTVAVIMSTYNGELYLKEQIESILKQRDVKVKLYIRDDGSTDSTIEIIRDFIDQGEKRVDLELGENCGPGSSFTRKLYNTPGNYDYYAYSDQDDIWLPNKLQKAIALIKITNKQLYMSNLMCIDKNGVELGLRNTQRLDVTPYSIMVNNETNGCTMVFTNSFYKMLTDEKRRPNEQLFQARHHDTWTAMIGVLTENFVYDFEYGIMYRQHENNVIGATNMMSKRKLWKIKVNKLRNKNKRNGRSKLAHEVYMKFPELLTNYPYILACSEPKKMKNKVYLIKNYPLYKRYGTQSFVAYLIYILSNLI